METWGQCYGPRKSRSSLIQVIQWTKAWATPDLGKFESNFKYPYFIIIGFDQTESWCFCCPTFMHFLFWKGSQFPSMVSVHIYLIIKDTDGFHAGIQGPKATVIGFREWSCEWIGANEKPLGCWWECWDQGTSSFFFLFVFALLFWSTRSGAAILWLPGVKLPVAIGKAQGWTQWEKMGPRIRKKREGKKASYLYSLDPYFQLCFQSQQLQRDEPRNYF